MAAPVDWVSVEPVESVNVLGVTVHRGERSCHTKRHQAKKNLQKIFTFRFHVSDILNRKMCRLQVLSNLVV